MRSAMHFSMKNFHVSEICRFKNESLRKNLIANLMPRISKKLSFSNLNCTSRIISVHLVGVDAKQYAPLQSSGTNKA